MYIYTYMCVYIIYIYIHLYLSLYVYIYICICILYVYVHGLPIRASAEGTFGRVDLTAHLRTKILDNINSNSTTPYYY